MCMEYQFLWKGRLWRVSVPDEVDGGERWIYVQAFVVSGGSHTVAMQAVLKERCPGIGWSSGLGAPMSFGLVSLASLVSLSNDSFLYSSLSSSLTDKSYPSFSSNNRSHKLRPPSSARPVKDAVSGTGDRRTPAPLRATSTASRPLAPGPAVVKKPLSKHPATPCTVGWMGSSSTTA
jgi:hypothetical protein